MPSRYRAIFFDLDGTLIEERAGIVEARAAVVAALRERGHAVSLTAYADAAEAVIQEVLVANGGSWPPAFSRLHAITNTLARLALPTTDAAALADVHLRARLDHLTLLDGAQTAVDWAHEDHPLGMITNGPGPEQREKLHRSGLAHRFETVTVSGEVGFGKPDAAIFEQALSSLEVAASDSVYVGNNFHGDILGALGAGMDAVWLRDGNRPPPAEASDCGCATITSMRELPTSVAARSAESEPRESTGEVT
ncbi:MAG: putative hydrolase of the HAD superfamily [Chloroflexi bacterium]|jgi:FMN phosphatase YigB (HAD superfamily)|nr:MAG: putative hydrolase of the HAD superfamily [Chloroflexota bacterium]